MCGVQVYTTLCLSFRRRADIVQLLYWKAWLGRRELTTAACSDQASSFSSCCYCLHLTWAVIDAHGSNSRHGRPRRVYKWPLSWCGHSVRRSTMQTARCNLFWQNSSPAAEMQRPTICVVCLSLLHAIRPFSDEKRQTDTSVSRTNIPCTNPNHSLKERIVLSEIHSELRDASCQWDHTVLSATRQRWPPPPSPQPGRLVLN